MNIKKGVLIISEGLLVGGEFVFDMNSISTTDMSEKYNQKLDNHLKNEDFFNVELYPTASIVIKRAMKYKDNLYNLVGELTIKDITRPIKFQANVDINGLNFSAQSKIKIDRTKWDITYKSGNYIKDLGDKYEVSTFALHKDFKILKKIKGIQLEKWYIVRLADTIQITTEETKNKGLMLNVAPTVIMKQLDLNQHY